MSNARNKRDVIGIDLGTTYSCVGAWKDNRAKIIPNLQGNPITPSYVTYTDNETLVGDEAKKQAIWNYKNTIFDSKRLIGRSISDEEVKKDIKHWPFEVMEKDGKLVYSVKSKQKTIYPTPKDIASEILKSLKKGAEHHLGNTVKKAVITVPAYFNNAQRQDTIEAGSIVGLNVLSILNEPTAAAIAYGFDNKKNHKRTVLVFDLGGGTFDVSLLNIVGEKFKVLATSGNTHLGGNDFDVRLVEYLLNEFQYEVGYNVSDNRSVIARLRAQSERVKCALSSAETASIDIDSLFNETDFQSTISRTKFNEICSDLFKSTLKYLDRVLNDTKLRKSNVDEIVMIGGSTRIPEIQRLVSDYFNNKELNKSINPEEAVARGAILHALKLTDNIENVFKGLSLIDITPISLGIEIVGEVMSKVVSRNTELPFSKTSVFTTVSDYQIRVKFPVYEGEKQHSKSNHLLGEFELTGIPPAPRGIPKIDVTFTVDTNGILMVRAYNRESQNSKEIKIIYNINRRADREIPKPPSKKTGDIVLAED